MKTLAIIQARMGSSRLPGKILADLGGMPILAWVVRAARAATLVDHVVVATTDSPADDATVALCEELGVDVVRGPEDDVLTRFLMVMREYPSELVVRLTADCPLLDPQLIDATVALAASPAAPDYASTTLVRTLPRGLDVEVVRAEVLERAGHEATGHHRIHVTSWVYTHPESFRCLGISRLPDASDLRVTVDAPEDLAAVRALVQHLPIEDMRSVAVVDALWGNPQLRAINAHIGQKGLTDG